MATKIILFRTIACTHTPSGSGSDAASISTTIKREGDKYIIKGQKCFTSGGGESDIYIIMCQHLPSQPKPSPYITAVLVPDPSPNLSFGVHKENKMGWRGGQVTRSVFLDHVEVPDSHLLLGEGLGFRVAMEGLDGARLSVAACSLGGAQRVMEIVRDRIKVYTACTVYMYVVHRYTPV